MSKGMELVQNIRSLSYRLYTSQADYWRYKDKAEESLKVY